MKWTSSLALLLAGVGCTSAHQHAQNLDQLHGSMCVTYVSTFLVPVHASKTGDHRTHIGDHHTHSASHNTHSGTHHTHSPTTTRSITTSSSSTVVPTQSVEPVQKVILAIVEVQGDSKRSIAERALRGFVGGGIVPNPDSCDAAAVFVLISGQLSLDQVPIFYENGESFKPFPGRESPTSQAVTTTFSITDSLLQFKNPSLPRGEAGFCQDSTSGQVYITFASTPPNCKAVFLIAARADLCVPSSETTQAPSASPFTEPTATATTTSREVVPTPKACTAYATLANPMKLLEAGDDDSAQVVLPFPVGVFNSFDTTVYININGRLSLFDDSDQWSNGVLPDRKLPPVSILPYFDDLVLVPGSGEYVGFEVQGTEVGSRAATFEWVAQRIGPDYRPLRFTATFFEDRPGIVTFLYSTVGGSTASIAVDTSNSTVPDNGFGATVGAQSLITGSRSRYIEFSMNEPGTIREGLAVQLDATGQIGSFKTGTFESILC